MSLINGQSGNILEVGAVNKAARTVAYPLDNLNWSTFSLKTGLITVLAAGAPIMSLRNSGSNLLLIKRIGLNAVVNTGFTAAQLIDFQFQIARGFTVSDSAGTVITTAGTNKHKTAQSNLSSVDLRVATTVALTAGTRNLDVNPITAIGAWALAATASLLIPKQDLLNFDAPSDYPLVLAQNEGLVLSPITAMGAGGVMTVYPEIEIAEISPAQFPN